MRKYLLVAVLSIALVAVPYVGAQCPSGCGGGALDDGHTIGGGLGVSFGMPSLYDNLISFWNLDEASGVRYDAHDGNHLTDINTVLWAAGVSAETVRSAQFVRANNEYLSHIDTASLSTGDIDFTFTCWCYLDSKPTTATLVSKWTVGLEYWLRYQGGGTDRFQFVLWNGAANTVTATTFGAPSLNTWYLVHAYHDSVGNSMGIQINNGAIDTFAITPGPSDTGDPFRIGDTANVHYWDGRIDAVLFSKRLLTPAERTYLYNGGFGRQYPF